MKIDKAQAVKWLRRLGLSCSGKKENLLARVEKYQKYPSLVKKLRANASWQCKFESSLDTINTSLPSSAWKTDFKLIPNVHQKMPHDYAAMRKEGSAGQQQKTKRML